MAHQFKALAKKKAADHAPNLIETNDDNLARNTVTSDNGQGKKEPVKVLGIPWDVDEDTLLHDYVKLSRYATTFSATKRSVLQLSAKIFDPIGLLTPFTIKMKIFFQELCFSEIDRDNESFWSIGKDWFKTWPT